MTEDVVNVLEEKKAPPTLIYLRWSKVLNKWVLGDKNDAGVLIYKLSK